MPGCTLGWKGQELVEKRLSSSSSSGESLPPQPRAGPRATGDAVEGDVLHTCTRLRMNHCFQAKATYRENTVTTALPTQL